MRLRCVLATLAALLLLATLPAHASSGTFYGTSSTAETDTWGVDNVAPCPAKDIAGCLAQPCTDDIFTRIVTLVLLDPSPGDAVVLSVAGDTPGGGSLSDPTLYPSDVATHDDPVAEVAIQLGGCNRTTTALVTGLVVEGEVSYAIRY